MKMFIHLAKKNMLVLLRNKNLLFTLFLMPMVLIAILGTALGSLMNSETSAIKAKVYLYDKGSETKDVERFIKEVNQSASIPTPVKKQLADAVGQMLPISILKEEVLGGEENHKNIEFHAISGEVGKSLQKKDTSAVIQVPEHFTYDFLRYYLLKEGQPPTLTIIENENEQISAGIVDNMVNDLRNEYAFRAILQKNGLPVDLAAVNKEINVEKKTVSGAQPINASTYYTFAMSSMFVLYVASTMASFALREKEIFIYKRIQLASVSPWSYLGSVLFSGSAIAFVQLLLLYLFAHFCFGVDIPSIPIFLLITLLLSFAIGGLSSLLAAFSFKDRTESIADAFGGIVVSVLAFIGGSFVPLDVFPDWFQKIGELSLNGAALKAFMKMAQEYDVGAIYPYLTTMLAYGIILLVAAVLIFPRKEAD